MPAPAGRADDFAWPRRTVAPVGADPVVATTGSADDAHGGGARYGTCLNHRCGPGPGRHHCRRRAETARPRPCCRLRSAGAPAAVQFLSVLVRRKMSVVASRFVHVDLARCGSGRLANDPRRICHGFQPAGRTSMREWPREVLGERRASLAQLGSAKTREGLTEDVARRAVPPHRHRQAKSGTYRGREPPHMPATPAWGNQPRIKDANEVTILMRRLTRSTKNMAKALKRLQGMIASRSCTGVGCDRGI